MRSRVARRIVVLGLVVTVGLWLPAQAAAAASEFDLGISDVGSGTKLDRFRGIQDIREDPPTVNGVTFVHPTQMDIGAVNGDFVAIGTANGAGTSLCADDYDAKWTVYSDGIVGGVYVCRDHDPDAYAKKESAAFAISWGFCPADSANRWLLSFGGTLWHCQFSSSTSAVRALAGLETVGAGGTDYDIDVKYTGLEVSKTNSSSFVAFSRNDSVVAASYILDDVSSTAFNTYLGILK